MTQKSKILIVDDEVLNLRVLVELLHGDYKTVVATDGKHALEQAATHPVPDLILLDVMMPEMDGYEVCERLRKDELTKDIPIIFVTAMSQVQEEARGFDLGAVDYITKPISPPILAARVRAHLELKKARETLKDQNLLLEELVKVRTAQLALTQDATIFSLAALAETRDPDTGGHIRRTQHYLRALAEHVKDHPAFAAQLDDEVVETLFKSAPLHDIGKVGVRDSILLKPGKLSDQEYEEMKNHTVYGQKALLNAQQTLGASTRFLDCALEIAISHHERWDGTGYPAGLKGEEIPLAGRLMAIADVYDALISKRCYKTALSHQEATAIIIEGAGTHFDPRLTASFAEIEVQFAAIASQFHDDGTSELSSSRRPPR